jgi:hypothetical protein
MSDVASSKEGSTYRVSYRLYAPVSERSIKTVDGIEINQGTHTNGTELNGFSLMVTACSEQDALVLAEGKANRVFDYLSYVHARAIRGYLDSMDEVKPAGEKITRIKFIGATTTIHNPLDLDLAEIGDVIKSGDEKLLRQLGHYSLGLKALDPASKYREFYQVIEDEKTSPKNTAMVASCIESITTIDNKTITRVIRNLLDHPFIDKRDLDIAKKLIEEMGLDKRTDIFLDLANPKDRALIEKYLQVVERDARNILYKHKLGPAPLSEGSRT